MKNIKIAILGLGNVGQGVWNILSTNKKEITKRCRCNIEVSKILVRDITKKREVAVPNDILTENAEDIFQDEDISVVIELLGGEQPALDYMLRAMKAKKHVITANKLVLAHHGRKLLDTSYKEGVSFYYEASVGGGIPIIREINESLTANKIQSIIGIINGTTNYILSKMSQEGCDFQQALAEAQAKGFAEADPTSDIEAYDAVYKLAIMSALSFGQYIDLKSIYREGITNIKAIDIEYAKKFGYVIKLLAIGKEKGSHLELKVHPAMVPENHPIANVHDSFNAIFIKGNAVGDLMLYGRGAGDLPTGSAVVGDLISVLRNAQPYPPIKTENEENTPKSIISFEETSSGYYIRLNTKDKPGILGKIAAIFGRYDVSVLTVTQDIRSSDNVSLVFITHVAKERNLQASLNEIALINEVNSVENIIRIESFN